MKRMVACLVSLVWTVVLVSLMKVQFQIQEYVIVVSVANDEPLAGIRLFANDDSLAGIRSFANDEPQAGIRSFAKDEPQAGIRSFAKDEPQAGISSFANDELQNNRSRPFVTTLAPIMFWIKLLMWILPILASCLGGAGAKLYRRESDDPETWTGRWLPERYPSPTTSHPDLHDSKHGVQMGIPSAYCDDAKFFQKITVEIINNTTLRLDLYRLVIEYRLLNCN
uniref:Uncharacterized protein n=1 Tax=Timema tahoe TaxID=61484 RepID=A0A7R9IKG1_9NEOP|nr:unnamed protein product [Timema tahoe]